MKGSSMDTNVYYLPAPADAGASEPRAERTGLWRRCRSAWWRLRVAFAEVRAIMRPRPRPASFDYVGLLEAVGEPIRRERRRPAPVIDFASARLRLRPAVQV
jgi:hypothetical protein